MENIRIGPDPAERDRGARIEVRPYTETQIADVLDFEKRLREEEDVWGWEIDEAYIRDV